MHNPSFLGSLHISHLRSWCSIRSRVRTDLLRSLLHYTQRIPEAKVEPRKIEQAISVHWHLLEPVGCGSFVFAI